MKKTYPILVSTIVAAAFLLVGAQTASAGTSFTSNMYLGMSGNPEVAAMQAILISEGFLHSTATGNFFNLTKQAVVAFQKENGISPTGYVGPLTRAALNEIVSSGDMSVGSAGMQSAYPTTSTTGTASSANGQMIPASGVTQTQQAQAPAPATVLTVSETATTTVVSPASLPAIVAASTMNTSGGSYSSSTDLTIYARLAEAYNVLGTNSDVVDGFNSAYNQGNANYFNTALQQSPSSMEIQRNYASSIASGYQALLTALAQFQTSVSSVNSTLSSFGVSSGLNTSQQSAVNDLNTYVIKNAQEYTTRTNAITAAWFKFKNLSTGTASVDFQTLSQAELDLAAQQSYFEGERSTIMGKITSTLSNF